MKKGFITVFLFVSLFFFYSNGVKADTYNFELDSTNFDLINEDFFLARELAIEFVNNPDNGYENYSIFYSFSRNVYYISFNNNWPGIIVTMYDTYFNFRYSSSTDSLPTYILENNKLVFDNNYSAMTRDISIVDNKLYYYFYLDTNISYYTNSYTPNFESITLTYSNYSETFTRYPPTLYSIYLATGGGVIEDIITEEEKFLSNFYTLIIEKISLLATKFTENYIFLTVFGIFIFIFIANLIRRFFL